MYIYSATRNTIHPDSPKMLILRRFLSAEHSFSFPPFPFPRDSLAFPFSPAVENITNVDDFSAIQGLPRKAPLGLIDGFDVEKLPDRTMDL